jgi:hypothetical protein
VATAAVPVVAGEPPYWLKTIATCAQSTVMPYN